MPSPDRHFANAAIFTHSTGLTPNSGDAALYIKSDNKAYIKDSAGTEAPVATIGGSTGATDNLVLRADGTGGATVQNSSIQIDDATTSTQNNVAIINADSQTNSALVLTPKGTGALLAQKPTGTSVGGNARGIHAVDWQTIRNTSAMVASGAYAVIGGGLWNTASGQSSVLAGGALNTASGLVSSVGGGRNNLASAIGAVVAGGGDDATQIGNTSSASYSAILGGLSGVADRLGMQAHSSGRFAANGDAQRARFVMRNKTTTNAAVELFLDGSATRLTIPSGKYLTGTINIAGIKSDGATAARYIRQFSIKNVAATTSLVGTVDTIGVDQAASTSISITADDTNDSLKVEVTGIAAEIWRWVASVDVVEVAYGT